MSQINFENNDTQRENWLLITFGILTVLALCLFGMGLFVALNDAENADVLPLCLSPLAIGGVALLMVWTRAWFGVSWRAMWLSLGIWSLGIIAFGFGAFGLVQPQEAADVQTNILVSVILCLIPGGICMLAAAGIYIYSYTQNGMGQTSFDDETEDW